MNKPESIYDVIILGAGGAGMMCAIHSGNRGRRTLLIDHAAKLGGKILISGGGRCNFTNLGATPLNYVSENPHFAKSAMSRYSPQDFVALVEKHGIPYHEKKLGQQFCDGSAREIVGMLEKECADAKCDRLLETKIEGVTRLSDDELPLRFEIKTNGGTFKTESLVIALGGLSIPKIGATGLGYDLAKKFGLKLIPRAAALDGFTFSGAEADLCRELSGVSVDCKIETNEITFRENILFTHSGLSGPASLQASLHWYPGMPITLDLLPDTDLFSWFKKKKKEGNRSIVKNLLSEHLPSRFVEKLCETDFRDALPLPQVSEKALEAFCSKLHAWKMNPTGTVGYSKAEVTRGGVDTNELSSKTMECKNIPGLYFIGEVVDVTGWLGGYNFQWAWASAFAAGQVV